MCADMCVGMCANMCVGMCADMYVDADMCIAERCSEHGMDQQGPHDQLHIHRSVAYIVMASTVMAYSHGQYSYGLYSYGLYCNGL